MNHIVVVRWLDSRGASPGWQHVSELTDGPCEMVSVGRLVVEDSRHVVIAPHFSVEDEEVDDQVCGAMYIPRAAIVQMDALLLPDSPSAPRPKGNEALLTYRHVELLRSLVSFAPLEDFAEVMDELREIVDLVEARVSPEGS